MLTALVQCNCHLVVRPYLKLPFELRSSQLLLCLYRKPLTSSALPIRNKGILHQLSLIKVFLGADSSDLKVVDLQDHGSKHSLSSTTCFNHTMINKYFTITELYLTFSKYGDKLLVVKSLINILKFTHLNIVFYSFFSHIFLI